jgi:polysaccharide biosynthesis/export protein
MAKWQLSISILRYSNEHSNAISHLLLPFSYSPRRFLMLMFYPHVFKPIAGLAGSFMLSMGVVFVGSQSVAAQVVAPLAAQQSVATPSQPSETDVVGGEIDENYTLGAGDRINIDIFNVPEYTGEKQVLVDGSISLPLLGNVSVRGLTLKQAAEAIAVAYTPYLRTPVVTVNLITPRPLRVAVAGEVHRPGSYDVILPNAATAAETEPQWPTVTRALQLAGGITPTANVRQVQIHRWQATTNQVIQLDLWTLLASGDLRQDMTLRDGDTIIVPTATHIDPAEATQLASASFSPATIRVNVVGEVTTPGTVEVPPNTPLNQALLAAGGFDNRRARRSTVELIRLNPDGSISQRTVPVNLANGINEATNPILYQNDVVIVGRSGSASFSDTLDGVLDTLGRIFPIFGLF